jgi:hypothetical protein
MKKIILIALCAIFAGSSTAQSLIETNKMWNVVECGNFDACYTVSYKFDGDTILGGITYNKLMQSWNAPSDYWNFHSAYREDEAGKVFINWGWDTEEQLFYDFDLEQGDVFYFHLPHSNDIIPMEVIEVDSVTILNGEKRKRITFYDYQTNEQWIEGIGSSNGVAYVASNWWYIIDLYLDLNCYFEDDELMYTLGNYETCWYTTVGIEDNLAAPAWVLSPNPFDDTFTVQSKTNLVQGVEVRISNLQGVILETQTYANTDRIIAGKNLKKGFYLVQVFENGRLVHSDKLIKR